MVIDNGIAPEPGSLLAPTMEVRARMERQAISHGFLPFGHQNFVPTMPTPPIQLRPDQEARLRGDARGQPRPTPAFVAPVLPAAAPSSTIGTDIGDELDLSRVEGAPESSEQPERRVRRKR